MHTGTFERETLWTEAVKLCGVKQHAASRRKPRFSLLEMEMPIVPKGDARDNLGGLYLFLSFTEAPDTITTSSL